MGLLSFLEEDPLKALALGAGIVATGGALAPALMGGLGAAGAAGAAGTAGAGAAAGAGTAAGAASGAGGLLGGMSQYLQPIGQALSAANSAKGLMSSGGQPIQAPQVPQGNAGGSQTLQQIYQQAMQPQITPEEQMRMQRKQSMWG